MVFAVKRLRIGILKKEGLHQWNASARGFLHGRVNERKKPVTQLDVALADRFLLRAARPGFVIGSALRGVIAIDRIEHAQLIPARQKIDRRRACETTDVCSNERITGKSEIHDLRNAHSDVIPGGAVVAGPGGCIAFGARIGRACEHEGPLVRPQLEKAIVGRASVFHAEDIVNGAMIERRAVVEAMNIVERHGFGKSLESRRLVHVIPEAGDSHVDEILVEAAPPIAHARQREIRKDAVAGPDYADIHRAVWSFDEDIVFDTGIVGRIAVARILFDMQIGDENGAHALRAKIRNHFFEIGEIFAVDGERRVALLIVDVKINDVGGNLFLAQSLDDLAGARFGIIAVAALLVAERPERRKRRAAHERGKLLDDFLGLRAGDKVVVQLAAFGSKRKIIGRLFAEVEAAAVGVVEENAVGRALAEGR